MPTPTSLAFNLKALKSQGYVHVSWEPTTYRMVMGPQPPRGAMSEVYPLAQKLASELRGLIV